MNISRQHRGPDRKKVKAAIQRAFDRLHPVLRKFILSRIPPVPNDDLKTLASTITPQRTFGKLLEIIVEERVILDMFYPTPIPRMLLTLCISLSKCGELSDMREFGPYNLLRYLEDLAFLAHALGRPDIRLEISTSFCECLPKIPHPDALKPEPTELHTLRAQRKPHDVYAVSCAMKTPAAAFDYLLEVLECLEEYSPGDDSPYIVSALAIHCPRREGFLNDPDFDGDAMIIRSAFVWADEPHVDNRLLQLLLFHMHPDWAGHVLTLSYSEFLHPDELDDDPECLDELLVGFVDSWVVFNRYLMSHFWYEVYHEEKNKFFRIDGSLVTWELSRDELEEHAQNGNPEAKVALAIIGIHQKPKPAFQALIATFAPLDPKSDDARMLSLVLGLCYACGHGCNRNEDLARKWLTHNRKWKDDELTVYLYGGKLMCEWETKFQKSPDAPFTHRLSRFIDSIGADPRGLNGAQPHSMLCQWCQVKPYQQSCPCRLVSYCSRECQQAAWPQHKAACSAKKKPVDQNS